MRDDVLGFMHAIFPCVYLQHPDAKEMQINLTGFLNGKNARIFLSELWEHLCSAQDNVTGIPNQFLEQKKNEIKQRQVFSMAFVFLQRCLVLRIQYFNYLCQRVQSCLWFWQIVSLFFTF